MFAINLENANVCICSYCENYYAIIKCYVIILEIFFNSFMLFLYLDVFLSFKERVIKLFIMLGRVLHFLAMKYKIQLSNFLQSLTVSPTELSTHDTIEEYRKIYFPESLVPNITA